MSRPSICMLVRGVCTHDARVLKEAKTLAASGYGVTVIAALAPGIRPVEERDGFRILRFPIVPVHHRLLRAVLGVGRGRRRGAAASAGGSAAVAGTLQEEQSLGPALRRLPRPLRSAALLADSPLLLADYVWRAFRATRGVPADVYHAHDLSTLPAAFALARLRGARLVYDSHELNLEAGHWAAIRGLPKRALRWQEGYLVRRADAVITVNDSLAGYLSEWYGIAKPAVVMNCPEPVEPTTEGFVLHRKLGLSPETRLVLYQGGLTDGRGLQELIAGFAQVEDAVLVLMGSGPLRGELETLSRELDLSERVRFLDPVSQEELLPHTASASAGVVCYRAGSLNNYLATPNKLFEYLMAGVPVAASDFPEMARIVREGDVGELFDPDDPASIAAAITRLLARPDYREMRARAAGLARTRYSWSEESERLLSVYERIAPVSGGRVDEERRPASPAAR